MIEGERRKRIVDAYIALPPLGHQTDRCLNFVQGCQCRTISHFLDTAKESNIKRLERMLNVVTPT